VDAQGSCYLGKAFTAIVSGLNLNNEVFGFYHGSPQYLVQREYYKPTQLWLSLGVGTREMRDRRSARSSIARSFIASGYSTSWSMSWEYRCAQKGRGRCQFAPHGRPNTKRQLKVSIYLGADSGIVTSPAASGPSTGLPGLFSSSRRACACCICRGVISLLRLLS
jgi:hypothetical protein